MKNNDNLKEQVKGKASELFFKYGPKHVSMDDIAEASGTSKKTLYQCFDDKQAIVHEVVDDLLRSHSQLFETSRSTSNDAIDEVLKQDAGLPSVCKSLRPSFLYELEIYFPDIWSQLEEYKSKIQRGILDNLQRGKEEGFYRVDLNIPVISDLRMQQLVNLLRPEVLTSLDLNTRELINIFTSLYLRSITTEKGKQLLDKYLNEKPNGA